MGPCERRRIGIRQTLGDSGMLLCDDAKELVLGGKQASVPRRDPAGLERVLPSRRQVRAQSEQLTEMIGHHRKMTQRPGRVVHPPRFPPSLTDGSPRCRAITTKTPAL